MKTPEISPATLLAQLERTVRGRDAIAHAKLQIYARQRAQALRQKADGREALARYKQGMNAA